MSTIALDLGQVKEKVVNKKSNLSYNKCLEFIEIVRYFYSFNKTKCNKEKLLSNSRYFKNTSVNYFSNLCIINFKLLKKIDTFGIRTNKDFRHISPSDFVFTTYNEYIISSDIRLIHNNSLTLSNIKDINRLSKIDSKITKKVLVVEIKEGEDILRKEDKYNAILNLYKINNPKLSIFLINGTKLDFHYKDIKNKLVLFPFDLNKLKNYSYGIAIILSKESKHFVFKDGRTKVPYYAYLGLSLAYIDKEFKTKFPYIQNYDKKENIITYPHQSEDIVPLKDIVVSPNSLTRYTCFGDYKQLLYDINKLKERIIVWTTSNNNVNPEDGWGAFIYKHMDKYPILIYKNQSLTILKVSSLESKDLKGANINNKIIEQTIEYKIKNRSNKNIKRIRNIFKNNKFSRNSKRKKRQIMFLYNLAKGDK